MRNYALNPNFDVRDYGEVVMLGSAGGYAANQWTVGPGTGGAVAVTFPPFPPGQTAVPGYPKNYMQIAWTAMATAGEGQYLPAFRWTFLEQHIFKAMELMGGPVNYDFFLSSNTPSLKVIPVFWINYSNGDYVIFSQPTVSYTGGWMHVSGLWNAPAMGADVLDGTEYIGFGLDLPDQYAPIIALSRFRICRPYEDVEIRPIALERYLSRN